MRILSRVLLLLALGPALAAADPLRYEFLLLPSAEAVGTFGREAPNTQIHDEVVQADMLLSLQKGPLKLFAEYLLSDHEGEFERLQLGYQLSDDTVVWVGRFHQPGSVWNHDHHHGQYLQTSVTRPAIDEWEDIGGVLPQHFTGALLESGKTVFDDWRVRVAMGAGIAPQITRKGMEPFSPLDPDSNRHQVGYQARVSLHPSEFTESGFGILLADDNLTAVGLEGSAQAALDHVNLKLIGAFGTYAAGDWKATATIYHADTRLYYNTYRGDTRFYVGYLQGERRVLRDFTVYARWEDSYGSGGSPYLRLFEQFARTRQVAGLRWDFVNRQALTLQTARTHTLDGRYTDIRVQWSAAFF
jgi:hypothetical protein